MNETPLEESELSDPVRELVERAYEIGEMTTMPGWHLLVGTVEKHIAANQRWLMHGHAKTVEEYRDRAGYLRGLTYVLEAPARVAELAQTRLKAEQKKPSTGT